MSPDVLVALPIVFARILIWLNVMLDLKSDKVTMLLLEVSIETEDLLSIRCELPYLDPLKLLEFFISISKKKNFVPEHQHDHVSA